MLIFFYLAVLITALYWVSKILGPEMAKSSIYQIPKSASDLGSVELTQTNEPDKRIEKLETLLAEKNKDIGLLQKDLRISHVQVRAFEKVKTLMDEEIHRLREQNRIFRSELGLPAVQPKENSIT